MARLKVRKGMPSVALDKAEFARRMRQHFYDQAFDSLEVEICKIVDAAWENYDNSRKSPRTRRAGAGFADPSYELSVEWIATREAIRRVERRQKSPASKSRILLINSSPRNDQTCPGEMSKTYRLVKIPRTSSAASAASSSSCSISAASPRSTAATSTPAKAASRRPCRSATGPAPVIPTIPSTR